VPAFVATPFSIRHGLSIAPVPLAAAVSVPLADGSVVSYGQQGASLPLQRTRRPAPLVA